jgi:hypothetical protein
MSRSIQRSKCNRSCDMCKPHRVTGERPIAEARRPQVVPDPRDMRPIDPDDDWEWHDNDDPACDGLCHWLTPCDCGPPDLHESFEVRPFASLLGAA